MKNKNLILSAFALLFGSVIFAQELFPPTSVVQGTFIGKTVRMDEFVPSEQTSSANVPTMVLDQIQASTGDNAENTTIAPTVIQNLQTEGGQIASLPLLQNFVGMNATGFFPPDATGAVGPNHYVHSVNSSVRIFDKTGTSILGPVSLGDFLGIPSNSGDPIVLYDQLADRWFVSEFGSLGANNGLAIGISETNDPTGAYNVYQFDIDGGFPDYPKYGVWHDGYYGTSNQIGGSSGGGATTASFVMDREAMIAGEPTAEMVFFNLPGVVPITPYVKSANPANLLGTIIDTSLPGYITYLQDDSWSSAITFDHLKVWEIEMDWDNTANSTISSPLEIPTDPFTSAGNQTFKQPGTSQEISAHGGIISFAANYRPFAGHNSWVITFNTYVDANQTGGIRWIELRNDSTNPWEIFQEGTYSIADGHDRGMSSSAMDAQGNIALGYITSSETLPVSLRYTGRFNGDPLGQMTLAETVIIDGPGVRNNANRFGDYSHMTMDPDNFTFWFTSDYFSSTNTWRTQIASFNISGGFEKDVGVNNILNPTDGILSNAETVEVNVKNYGVNPQSNIPLELRVDGNLVATEVFGGTISANDSDTYTFTQTVDMSNQGQTYSIEVRTDLSGDEFTLNDSYSADVKHLHNDDVGSVEITSPVTGLELGNETVTVTLQNFGADTQSNFEVQYTVNNGTPVVETFAGPIASGDIESFSFSQTADLSVLGTYEIKVSTNLANDGDTTNDEATIIIDNNPCEPAQNCSLGHGFTLFRVGGINKNSGCEGYADFTDFIAALEPGSTNDLTLRSGYGNQYFTVWIDYNDDLTFTNNEKVVTDYILAPGEAAGNYLETIDLVLPSNATVGEHKMRAKSNWNAPVPDDACESTQFGETEDYTVIVGTLGVEDNEISNSNLIVTSLPNNQFEVLLNTEFDGGLYLGVYNMLGQEVGFNKNVPRTNNAYKINLDMSKMASGVYLVKMGGVETTASKTARIIVK